ncbi:hypothetical protein YC2023_047324 [Brassica napus]
MDSLEEEVLEVAPLDFSIQPPYSHTGSINEIWSPLHQNREHSPSSDPSPMLRPISRGETVTYSQTSDKRIPWGLHW